MPIPGQPGYEASDQGRVRSNKRTGSWMVLAPGTDRAGYLRVGLWQGATRITKRVHVAVAEAFLGPRPEGLEVRHLDDDKSNNYLSNLAWGTPTENHLDRVRNGIHHNSIKTHCPQRHAYAEHGRVWKGKRYCTACGRDKARAKYRAAAEVTS
jgi:hypothetical protein